MRIPKHPCIHSYYDYWELDDFFRRRIPKQNFSNEINKKHGDWKEWGCELLFPCHIFLPAIESAVEIRDQRRKIKTDDAPSDFLDLGCSIGHKLFLANHPSLFPEHSRKLGVEFRRETAKAGNALLKKLKVPNSAIYCGDIFDQSLLLQSLSNDSIIYTYNPVKDRQKDLALFILEHMPVSAYWLEVYPKDYTPSYGTRSHGQLIQKINRDNFINLCATNNQFTLTDAQNIPNYK
jgi:hypothetical protein